MTSVTLHQSQTSPYQPRVQPNPGARPPQDSPAEESATPDARTAGFLNRASSDRLRTLYPQDDFSSMRSLLSFSQLEMNRQVRAYRLRGQESLRGLAFQMLRQGGDSKAALEFLKISGSNQAGSSFGPEATASPGNSRTGAASGADAAGSPAGGADGVAGGSSGGAGDAGDGAASAAAGSQDGVDAAGSGGAGASDNPGDSSPTESASGSSGAGSSGAGSSGAGGSDSGGSESGGSSSGGSSGADGGGQPSGDSSLLDILV